MRRTIKIILTTVILFLVGAVFAFLIYWLANNVFNAEISKSAMIVNIVTDGIIFIAAAFIYQGVTNKHSKKK